MSYVKRILNLGIGFASIGARTFRRPKTLLPLMTMAILSALLVPLFGPLVDHHFAERQPGHVHLYLTGVPTQHLHFHEAHHSHDSPPAGPSDVGSSGPVLENNIIFMPQEGEGLSVSAAGVTLALLSTVIALALPTMITLISPRGQQSLRGITPHPEPPPPRLAL